MLDVDDIKERKGENEKTRKREALLDVDDVKK